MDENKDEENNKKIIIFQEYNDNKIKKMRLEKEKKMRIELKLGG